MAKEKEKDVASPKQPEAQPKQAEKAQGSEQSEKKAPTAAKPGKPGKPGKVDTVPNKAPTRLKPGEGVSRKMAHKSIHPPYVESTITCGCGNVIHTRSTKPAMTVGVCSKCHPFYSGQQKFIDTAGRVERFQKRYGWIEGKTPQEVAASRKERLARAKAVAKERLAKVLATSKLAGAAGWSAAAQPTPSPSAEETAKEAQPATAAPAEKKPDAKAAETKGQ